MTGCYGFESRAALSEGITLVGTASFDTTTFRTGSAALRCNPASGATGLWANGSRLVVDRWIHFAMNVATLPSLSRLIFGQSPVANDLNMRLTSAGALEVRVNTTVLGTSSTAFSSPGWHWVGVRVTTGTSAVFLQIDGVNEVTGTATVTSFGNQIGFASTEASAADVYFDDIIVDDAGFIGPSNVNLAVPISDNARASLWTGGSGGTTDLFDAVDNKPPVGTATESNTTQIEHAGGAAGTTDAYDANMTTYTNLGINSGDTVLGIDWNIVHGEDVGTGTKLLNFSLASNPTQASGIANFAAGADVGALGTFPSNWTNTRNTVLASPSVTLGSSPVMRVTRPETASRVASVCFMGMNVAWTPAAAERVPYYRPMTQLLAH